VERKRWLTFEGAKALCVEVAARGWPSDLVAVERAWSGQDGDEVMLHAGYRVVMVEMEGHLGRIRNLTEARTFCVHWGGRGWQEPSDTDSGARVPVPVAAV
jgi:hypothetical protein